jgi:hypothetical protein
MNDYDLRALWKELDEFEKEVFFRIIVMKFSAFSLTVNRAVG